jgi:hypothetical protein
LGTREEVKGSSGSGCKWGNKLGGGPLMAHDGVRCTRARRGGNDFYSPLGRVRRFMTDWLKPGHGMAR